MNLFSVVSEWLVCHRVLLCFTVLLCLIVFLSCLLCCIVLTQWEALNLELIINSIAVSNVLDKDELDWTG